MRGSRRGFTLLELLVVVALVGILSAILIPNLLIALQKAKQKRTAADIRNVGTAWMSWLTDQVGAASAGSGKSYDASGFSEHTYGQVFGYLHPNDTFFYMQEVPELDGWNYPLAFGRADSLQGARVLIVCSSGADGAFTDGDCTKDHEVAPFIATDFDRDIVWADGYFISWPSTLAM